MSLAVVHRWGQRLPAEWMEYGAKMSDQRWAAIFEAQLEARELDSIQVWAEEVEAARLTEEVELEALLPKHRVTKKKVVVATTPKAKARQQKKADVRKKRQQGRRAAEKLIPALTSEEARHSAGLSKRQA